MKKSKRLGVMIFLLWIKNKEVLSFVGLEIKISSLFWSKVGLL